MLLWDGLESSHPEKQKQTLLSETSYCETSVAMCQLTAVVHKSIQQITSRSSVLASGSGCRRAQLSHLTDIWSISVHIWLLIFCSMWVEKKGRSDISESPKAHSKITVPTHTARVVKCHDLIICTDLILSPRRLAISFKETPVVKSVGGFFVATALSQPYIHRPKQRRSTVSRRQEAGLWGTQRAH